jgi:hypothetical protein
LHRSTAAELAALAWTEGLKFCHLKYGGGDVCDEPCDACYQTALNRLIVEARRMRQAIAKDMLRVLPWHQAG